MTVISDSFVRVVGARLKVETRVISSIFGSLQPAFWISVSRVQPARVLFTLVKLSRCGCVYVTLVHRFLLA